MSPEQLVERLRDPYKDWPTSFTPEGQLCRQAADLITTLIKKGK